MYKHEVEKYAKYQVSGDIDGQHRVIAVCDDEEIAFWIANKLAELNMKNDKFYVSPIINQADLFCGGGTYTIFYKDELGIVQHYTLS